ncbi:MAG: dephospho-CoA kinase [Flavobacteriales bacterium]
MRRIGLTGGIGAGKSTVARVLQKMGYPVFFSDAEAKRLYDTNPLLKKELIVLFGDDVYQSGLFQNQVLAQKLFQNPSLKQKVSQLIHPLVRQKFEQWALQQKTTLVFNEAAILFETGAYLNFDATILVLAPVELRKQRVAERDGMSIAQIEQRIANQWSDAEKIKLASFVIENDGQPLLSQIEKVISELEQEALA